MRVVVTASNAGGSTPASSLATAVVAAVESEGLLVGSSTVQASGDTDSAGTAEAFQYTATAGGTVRSLALYVNSGGSAPTITVGLYTNVSGHPGMLLTSATIGSPLAGAWNAVGVPAVTVSSGSIYWLAALAPNGTLAMRDVASGGGPTQSSASNTLKELPASWSSGSSWSNSPASFYASGAAVSPPPAPVNTAAPAIGGTATEGQALSVSNGSWANSPTSFAYQWQDCNALGEGCANVSGATGSTYTLGSGDVGHTMRVTVTATNSGGVGTATSEHSAVVGEKVGTSPTGCFGHEEACGYPGPEDTGVEKGVTLTKHAGSLLVTKEGETIKDEKIEGNLEIAANNVTVENVEVVTYSQKRACEKEEGAEGSGGLQVQEHKREISTGIVIKHVTVHGVTQSCPEDLGNGVSIQQASAATDVKIEWSKVYWTGQCFRYSAWYENDYCDDNGELPAYGKVSNAHYDGVFDNGTGTLRAKPGLVIRHNTIIVPHWQTATMNLSNEEEVGEERIENNFLAGGGYLMYLPGANTKAGAPAVRGPVEVVGNRFARCSGKVVAGAFGHSLCEGLAGENETTDAPMTPDAHGYFPYGGGYGELYSSYNSEKDHFSGNYWDDNLEAAL
jgi:hypothetical protein